MKNRDLLLKLLTMDINAEVIVDGASEFMIDELVDDAVISIIKQ